MWQSAKSLETRTTPAVSYRFLNVGGGTKDAPLPSHYADWDHVLLDIDPAVSPDICLDARELDTLLPGAFDAIYCSHNLEHYYAHDVPRVLNGFRHILGQHGFAEIRVPDMGQLFQEIISRKLDIDDELYVSDRGPVLVKDVIYGYGPEIEESGEDFYAHRTGFTRKSLVRALGRAGFARILPIAPRQRELAVLAFKDRPNPEIAQLLGVRRSDVPSP
jgi:hypothetical protein